jgi:hypothetical protein
MRFQWRKNKPVAFSPNAKAKHANGGGQGPAEEEIQGLWGYVELLRNERPHVVVILQQIQYSLDSTFRPWSLQFLNG